jgi:DNA-binding IclR family transcriptional regulator
MRFDSLDKGLYVIEETHKLGRMTVKVLGMRQGWDRSQASRYLRHLSDAGWLERFMSDGQPVYVLGKRLLRMIEGFSI